MISPFRFHLSDFTFHLSHRRLLHCAWPGACAAETSREFFINVCGSSSGWDCSMDRTMVLVHSLYPPRSAEYEIQPSITTYPPQQPLQTPLSASRSYTPSAHLPSPIIPHSQPNFNSLVPTQLPATPQPPTLNLQSRFLSLHPSVPSAVSGSSVVAETRTWGSAVPP